MEPKENNVSGSTRILFSSVFITIFVLLSIMWARSYWWVDIVIAPQSGSQTQQFLSGDGWLGVHFRKNLEPNVFPDWVHDSLPFKPIEGPSPRFGWEDAETFLSPYWLPVFACLCLATIFGWKQDWRFSLKTMLIAISVVAVAVFLILKSLQM